MGAGRWVAVAGVGGRRRRPFTAAGEVAGTAGGSADGGTERERGVGSRGIFNADNFLVPRRGMIGEVGGDGGGGGGGISGLGVISGGGGISGGDDGGVSGDDSRAILEIRCERSLCRFKSRYALPHISHDPRCRFRDPAMTRED